jgi:hypothetical protein
LEKLLVGYTVEVADKVLRSRIMQTDRSKKEVG